jgi:hypothetical protein
MNFQKFLKETRQRSIMKHYSGWVKPTEKDLQHEYKVEYEIKSLKSLTGNAWPTFEDFLNSANNARVLEVTPDIDARIAYRSGTNSYDELLNLIKGYRSYPEYRNEKTLKGLYDAFDRGGEMTMPIVLKFKNGNMRVMGGNTRMDVAFQKGYLPKVLLIEVP